MDSGRTYFQHASEVDDIPHTEQRHLLRKAESAYLRSLEKCELLRGHIDDAEYQEMKTRLLLNIGTVYRHNDTSCHHTMCILKSYCINWSVILV